MVLVRHSPWWEPLLCALLHAGKGNEGRKETALTGIYPSLICCYLRPLSVANNILGD